MEDKNKLNDDVRAAPEQGSGSLLAAERKAQSKTVEEVAQQLNLSVTQIRTIELDQSEGLPEPTYVRGYIRSYANLLGLDAEQILEHYLNPNWQKGTRLDDLPKGMASGGSNANVGDRRGFFSVGKMLLLAVLIGLSVFMWKTGRLDGFLGGKTSPPVTNLESTVTLEGTNSAPLLENAATLETQSEEVLELAVTDSSELTETGSDLEVATDDVISHNLVLSFSDTSWIDIRDSEGKRLAYKSYTGGEDLSVSSALPMSVFIGNAKAVSATYNGADFDLAAHREGVFARFSLGE